MASPCTTAAPPSASSSSSAAAAAIVREPDLSCVLRGMPVVGILDGVSYVSGADYFMQIHKRIQQQAPRKTAGNTSRMVMYCVNLEEYVAYLEADRLDLASDLLVDAATRLHRAGADFLVIASNTSHLCVPKIKYVILFLKVKKKPNNSVPFSDSASKFFVAQYVRPCICLSLASLCSAALPGFPILHIADCYAKVIRERGLTNCALVGTKFAMQGKWISDRLAQHGITAIIPSDTAHHDELNRIIEHELSFGEFKEESRRWLIDVVRSDCVARQVRCVAHNNCLCWWRCGVF